LPNIKNPLSDQVEILNKLLGRLVLVAIFGLSLYLWAYLLGGGSLLAGFKALGIVVAVGVVAALPKKPIWSKTVKALVLLGLVSWTISDMLPIETTGQWLASILIGGVLCLIGYAILFEDFLN
jgi:hypothetical protein